MTQEEKQLLLKDLCARLPYGIKAYFKENAVDIISVEIGYNYIFNSVLIIEDAYTGRNSWEGIGKVKPYLRSMSRMTEEEKQKYYDLTHQEDDDVWAKCLFDKMVDFCNERHLDYRGLIEKGLALEAPEGMYKNE